MNPTFYSQDLSRKLFLSDVKRLSVSDQKLLLEETRDAVRDIDIKIKEVGSLERRSGIKSDSDWLHRANKKRRVCLEFAAELNTMLGGATRPKVDYDEAFNKHFNEILLHYLGADLERIKNEAAVLARADVERR